jgi:hypothetical protein
MNTNNENNPAALPVLTVNVKGVPVTFTSAFSALADAWSALSKADRKSDFAVSLLLLAARERRLTPAQAAWIHKLATDAVSPPAPRPTAEGLNLAPVVALMDKAAAAQKRLPKIELRTSQDPTGTPVVLRQAGARSNAPGSVSITDGAPFGRNLYFGRINRDGTVTKGREWRGDVEALLHRLAVDPAAVAGQHGVATGICCFCGLLLSTAESRSVGYGPICAEKFGLPWGDTSVADAADAAAKEAAAALAQRTATNRSGSGADPEDLLEEYHNRLLDEEDAEREGRDVALDVPVVASEAARESVYPSQYRSARGYRGGD